MTDATEKAVKRAVAADRRKTIQILKKAARGWRAQAREVQSMIPPNVIRSVLHGTAAEYNNRADHLANDAVAELQDAWAEEKRR